MTAGVWLRLPAGTGTIGEAIARRIAQDLKYEVILVCRNAAKAERACSNISSVNGNTRVRYEVVDLSRRSSIQSLGERWLGPLHVLVNNAADTPRDRQMTTDGLEVQFATNIMGYFWMIQRVIGTIRREFLDHTLFWNNVDLERKLADFQTYYNHHRAHSSLGGDTPAEFAGDTPKLQTTLNDFRWQTHCRGLYQLPAAA